MTRLELTTEEVQTVLVALDNYGDLMETTFQETGDPQDEEEMGSAEWCWQKIYGQAKEQFNNSVADAVGEGEQPDNQPTTPIDPYTLPTWTD